MVVVGGWARNPPTALSAISQRWEKVGALLVAAEMQKSVPCILARRVSFVHNSAPCSIAVAHTIASGSLMRSTRRRLTARARMAGVSSQTVTLARNALTFFSSSSVSVGHASNSISVITDTP